MIKNYVKGYPCKITKGPNVLFGRIIGESEEGQWGNIEGKRVFSIPLFSTPQGSILKTGVFHLEDLDETDWEKLNNFEQYAETQGFLYEEKLTVKEIEEANKVAKS